MQGAEVTRGINVDRWNAFSSDRQRYYGAIAAARGVAAQPLPAEILEEVSTASPPPGVVVAAGNPWQGLSFKEAVKRVRADARQRAETENREQDALNASLIAFAQQQRETFPGLVREGIKDAGLGMGTTAKEFSLVHWPTFVGSFIEWILERLGVPGTKSSEKGVGSLMPHLALRRSWDVLHRPYKAHQQPSFPKGFKASPAQRSPCRLAGRCVCAGFDQLTAFKNSLLAVLKGFFKKGAPTKPLMESAYGVLRITFVGHPESDLWIHV